MQWKIKRFTNDELRQRFIDTLAPQAGYLDLKIPDPDLRWNEEHGRYAFGAIDWAEFRRVISGDGPCNRERLAARRKAHEDGRWVREAASAHAGKRRHRQSTKAA